MGRGPDGKEDRRHVTGRTQSDVARKVKALEKQREAGTVVVTGGTTVAAYLAGWIARKEKMRAVRERTVLGYRTDEKHVVAAIGKVRVDRLGPANIEHLWGYMLDRDLRVAHCRRTLNAALNDAVRRGLLVRNPIKVADTPRDETTEIDPYDTAQMIALLAASIGERNGTRWAVGMLGLRQGEVLGLRWNDLDIPSNTDTKGVLIVRQQLRRAAWRHGCSDPGRCLTKAGTPTKRGADCPQRWGGGLKLSAPKSTAARRTLTLPIGVTDELRSHRKAQLAERMASEVWEQGPDGGWVFPNEIGGPTDPNRDGRDFKALCLKAGVPPRRLHDLRHSAATMMLESDLDLKTVGQVLGHSQIALTARYSHILEDRKSVAADRIDVALFGAKRAR
jgi:integrase